MSLLAGLPKVDSKTVFSEDLGPCIPVWKNPSKMHGCKWGLLKGKGNTKGVWWGAGGVHQQSMLLFFSCF
jgi:hypothetical protein